MARDAIGMSGCYIEDNGNPLPTPSSFDSIAHSTSDIVTLVDIDFTAYRKANENKAVRKNCTIPNWLNIEAEKLALISQRFFKKLYKKN